MPTKKSLTKRNTGPWWTPLAMIGTSVTANLLVWGLARLFGPASLAEFEPLSGPGSVILLSAVGAIGAYYCYWFIAQLTPKPNKIYLILSVFVLLFSLIPDIEYPTSSPGYSTFAIAILIIMHFVAAVADVGILLWSIQRQSR